MPVKSYVYILAEDDSLIIEGIKIPSKNVSGFKIFYDLSGENTDSFGYAFRIVFKNEEIDEFIKIKNNLDSSENIQWFNKNQNITLNLTVKDATVSYNDDEMMKKKKQVLDIIVFMESDELKESNAS